MTGDAAAKEERRPFLARTGIVLLNLAAPGLGLLRVQRPRPAIVLLLVPQVLIALLILYFALAPTPSFWGWAGPALAALAILLVAYTAAMMMSWRASRPLQAAGPWWSRWYSLLALFAVGFAISWVSGDIALSFYKGFYVRSSSMSPTLVPGDHFLASMRGPRGPGRGELALVETDGGAIYISRIAALPGDRIALIDGIVWLNGRAVPQRLVRTDPLPPEERRSGFGEARRLAEHFPDEASPHEIYDTGWSPGDDYPETLIPPGHVFLLGDNRDNAADSRISRARMGLELVPIERIRGRPLYHSWRSSRPVGTPIGGS